MRDFHRSGDAHVILRVSAQNVRATIQDKISFRLKAAYVLSAEDGSPNHLTKFQLSELRDSRIASRIFQPKKVGFIASSADRQSTQVSSDLTSRIDHQGHLVTDYLADMLKWILSEKVWSEHDRLEQAPWEFMNLDAADLRCHASS
jgi:hypothetical protein